MKEKKNSTQITHSDPKVSRQEKCPDDNEQRADNKETRGQSNGFVRDFGWALFELQRRRNISGNKRFFL